MNFQYIIKDICYELLGSNASKTTEKRRQTKTKTGEQSIKEMSPKQQTSMAILTSSTTNQFSFGEPTSCFQVPTKKSLNKIHKFTTRKIRQPCTVFSTQSQAWFKAKA